MALAAAAAAAASAAAAAPQSPSAELTSPSATLLALTSNLDVAAGDAAGAGTAGADDHGASSPSGASDAGKALTAPRKRRRHFHLPPILKLMGSSNNSSGTGAHGASGGFMGALLSPTTAESPAMLADFDGEHAQQPSAVKRMAGFVLPGSGKAAAAARDALHVPHTAPVSPTAASGQTPSTPVTADTTPSADDLALIPPAPVGGKPAGRSASAPSMGASARPVAVAGGTSEADADAAVAAAVASSAETPLNVPGVEEVSATQAKICLDDFQLIKLIGKGTFGKVLLAKHKQTGKPCAIKVISKAVLKNHPNEIRHVMSERNVLMRNMKHPFLIGLQYAFQTPLKLYLVLDYVNGGELFFHLQRERRFPEDRVRFYAAEITSALEYLHGLHILYRDLKPENLLLDREGHIALTDFGLAKENMHLTDGRTRTFCGTPEYLAPEIVKRQPYGLAVDWWCLGSVVYEMLVGLPPFYSANTQELFQRILHDKLKWPAHIPVSSAARAFVAALLVRHPEARLGARGGAREVKAHIFFAGVDWNKLVNKLYRPPFVPDLESTLDLRYIDPAFKDEDLTSGSVSTVSKAAWAAKHAAADGHVNGDEHHGAASATAPTAAGTAAIAKPVKDKKLKTPWSKSAAKKASAASATAPTAAASSAAANGHGGGDLDAIRDHVLAESESDDDAFAGFTYYGTGPDEDVLRDVYGSDVSSSEAEGDGDEDEDEGDETPSERSTGVRLAPASYGSSP
ncbi:AGC/SGK protein kinase [Allomyces macrogynus ATCC 38327]|uniref:AGC/SGK protein kinase n=1 Tax=Allomyces macrogynus (strain ATCC 38327) TaxID=578462 RepID=A0A0L0T063_ALLM3|nr:AGC/SGK protein kinase [Allomyces macrogynus ATCC 38327]|eukprot:KNE68142.1 AGC/SGK protein kinase [Allomyces macrogynus ATCC 38327]